MRACILALRRTFDWKPTQMPTFCRLVGIEEPQDPTCVKSRTGYLIRLGRHPIIWRSKLQTLVSVSTMEAKYVALSMCMRELIPLKRIYRPPQLFRG